ncbi:ATP-binding cassette domain-containing protein [Epibacterium sp. SM1979]|uniref:ATP-binding cassette domain-containing protein n=1 Tax=Tritonibacter litoralis TaxID=2662264 RepID=A0A843YFB9_9RHOB|nr:ATP-binding cassette domain-containing protein [Tritonibacter litoralis]MQQ07789.1 ATP-binding cassette domain-containing protein [Tritonibacter litoralis]
MRSMVQTRKSEMIGAWLSVLASLIWLCGAAVIARVLGRLLMGDDVSAIAAGAALFLLWALRTATEAAAQRCLSQAAEAKITELRQEIVTREAASASASTLAGEGALAALVAEKLETLRPALLRYRPARLRVLVLPAVILCLTAWHSWAVAIVLLVAGPLIPVFMALVGWAAKEASARQMQEIGQLSDLLVDRLAALSDLQLLGAGKSTVETFARASDTLRQRTMAVLQIAFLSSTVLELFSALGVALVAIWVGFTLLGELNWGGWGVPLTPVAGVYLLLMAPEFFQPLRDLAAAWHDRAAVDAVMDELAAWRDEDRAKRLGHGATEPALSHTPSIAIQNLHHRGITYPNIRIEPGESLALEGVSGAGKTTLLRLIAGLEQPDRGTILIDGVALTEENANQWRASIGWMPQAPHFFNGSLRYNVGLGAPVSDDTLVAAGLETIIQDLPRGDLTRLGERGAGLSGGEGRRVTLARALHGAPRVLIADEPTADLDAETARRISDSLLQFTKDGGTLLVASHDTALINRLQKRVSIQRDTDAA